MRRKSKFRIPAKYVLPGLTVVCIAAMYISFALNLGGGPLNTVAGAIFGPMQRGINSIGSFLSDRADNLKSMREVMEENELLKQQVAELTQEINSMKLDQNELESLRQLLDLDKQYSDYEKTAARVIGKDPGNWFHTFLIDKGSEDGIDVDMNVLSGSGLVGIVIDVGPHYAKVRSIIDDRSSVYGMVLSTSDNCIVSGDLVSMAEDQVVIFTNLNDDDDQVQPGDQIVTSNVSDKYLPGILIGYISNISEDSNHLTKSGTITPVVDFEHLQQVLVILDKKDMGTS